MIGSTNAGSGAGLKKRGAWVSGTTYKKDDWVYTADGQFVCIQNTSGTTTPKDDTTHWSKVYETQFKEKLTSQLKTYYNIGKITADARNPVVIGNVGDDISTVLNNICGLTVLQPSKTEPSLALSLSLPTGTSEEIGTTVSSLRYTITPNNGSYTYDNSTGVTWSDYTFSGAGTGSVGTTTSGTINLTSNYQIGVTNPISLTATGTHSAGNIATDNAGNASNPTVQISAGTKDATTTFSKSGYIPSFIMLSTSLPVDLSTYVKKARSILGNQAVSGGTSSTYMYLLVPATSSITSITSSGFAVPFSTVSASTNYTLNGVTVAMKIYKTDSTVSTDTFVIA